MSGAKKIETTSDVTRFRGVLLAAVVAAFATTILSVALSSRHEMRGTPGPLSRSHTEAGLSCDSCHSADRTAKKNCLGCHQGHTSTRPGHAALLRDGELVCSSCHTGHGNHDVVTLRPDGLAVRHAAGRDVAETSAGYRPLVETRVPIPGAGACAACHDLESPTDPLAACLVGDDPGSHRSTLCLDEHVRVGGARDAAWEAARRVVIGTSVDKPVKGFQLGPWSWIGLGWLIGFVVFGASRTRAFRGRKSKQREVALQAPEVQRLPVINTATCLGCHACVDTCPFDVLEIKQYVAVVARPSACCGLTLCEQRCPNGSLVMGDGTAAQDAVPLDETLQAEISPGIYLAGDVTGLPLIRNAINQGAHAARAVEKDLGRKKGQNDLDVVIIGAGPAGISAALEAKSLGLRYKVLEQATVAGSIQSFPRAKLVFDQPLDLPLVGQLWLEESTKEELLSRWLRVVRSEELAIHEGHRVTDVHRSDDGGFVVSACNEEDSVSEYRCQRVLLAIGKRGSPRTLPIEIPSGMEKNVFHSLADARSFAGQRLVVVGLGDVAMEAAIALSRQPETRVIVVHRGQDFARGKSRNIEELRRRVASGAIELHLATRVTRIDDGNVQLSSNSEDFTVSCDGLFVLIGSIPPTTFLSQVGVLPSSAEQENEK